MELNEFQGKAIETAVYPGRWAVGGILYTALGLAGEAGEVADKVKKIIRDDEGILLDHKAEEIAKELGDVLWYVATLAEELGYQLEEIALANYDKLASRAERNVLTGAGDNR